MICKAWSIKKAAGLCVASILILTALPAVVWACVPGADEGMTIAISPVISVTDELPGGG
jgi:hypothetical protein